MKRIAVVLLSFVMLVSSTACKSNTSTTGNHESAAENLQDSEKIQLTNQNIKFVLSIMQQMNFAKLLRIIAAI